MKIKKLMEKKAELRAEMQSVIDTATAEERAVSEEEAKRFDELEKEIRAIEKTIEMADKTRNIAENAVSCSDTEDRAKAEERAFGDYIRGRVAEMRADGMTMDSNGAVIPESIAKRIVDTVKDLCPILSGAEIYNVRGTLKIPKWTKENGHDITVGFQEEFTEITAKNGKFESVDLGGYLAGALTLIGKSVENNSTVNIVDFVVKKMSEAVAEFYEKTLLNGSEKTQGILETKNTVTAKSADSVGFSDLVRLQSAVKQVYQKNACWTMSPDTFTAVKLLTDTNGRPLLEPDATKSFPYTLLGKPVYISDNMPEATDGKSVLYGDYSGLSVNIRENISIEVLREKYATQHAIGVVAWFEFDAKITDEQKIAVLVHTA